MYVLQPFLCLYLLLATFPTGDHLPWEKNTATCTASAGFPFSLLPLPTFSIFSVLPSYAYFSLLFPSIFYFIFSYYVCFALLIPGRYSHTTGSIRTPFSLAACLYVVFPYLSSHPPIPAWFFSSTFTSCLPTTFFHTPLLLSPIPFHTPCIYICFLLGFTCYSLSYSRILQLVGTLFVFLFDKTLGRT